MEWIGIGIGAVASVAVAFIGIYAERSGANEVKLLSESRKDLKGAPADAVDAAIVVIAESIKKQHKSKWTALPRIGAGLAVGGLLALLAVMKFAADLGKELEPGVQMTSKALLAIAALGAVLAIVGLVDRLLARR